MAGIFLIMKNIVLTIIALVFFAPVAMGCENHDGLDMPIEKLSIQSSSGKTHEFHVEVANTPQTVMKGLMHRESMAENHGMLFLFPEERERNFWMKNTLIPLDIVFIKTDGTIHHIHENAIPLDETPLPSKGVVRHVLEINGGVAEKLGLKAGDTVHHEVFGNVLAQ